MKWLFTSLLALLLSVQSFDVHACAIPEGLAVNNITNNSAVLSWNAVPGALRYELEVENGANTPQYVFDTLTASTSLTITGLVANGNYVFKVKSECEPGSSDYSPWFAFSTSGGGGSDSCAVPTGLAVTNVTATGATLSWNAATGALHYQVEVENGVNTPQYVFDTLTASTSLTITGLVANGNYVFKVKSECEPGSSDYSPLFAFSTSGGGGSDSCAIPTGLAVTNVTATGATLSWNAATGALHYQVEVENAVNTPQYVFDTLTAMTTVTITGLVANGSYVFKVKSECEPGSSDYSPWFAFGTSGGGSDSCAIPTGLAVTNVTATGATLSWNAATGALHYQVEVENAVNTPQYVFDTLTAMTTVTITGLVANGSYVFKVKSECEPGSSDYSPWFAFGTSGGGSDSCAIPTGLAVTNVTATGATLSWNAATGALHYQVEVENAVNTPQYVFDTLTAMTTVTITGLVANGSYVFKVKSECEPGSSDYSPWFAFGTSGGGSDSCAVPTGLAVTNVTATGAVLSWNAAAGAQHYQVEVENGVNTPQYVFDTLTAMTTVTITGLVANGNYVFKVKSECEPGSSDYSPLFAFSTSGGGGSDSCAVPTGLAVTNVTATGATLSWNAATGALHYQVEVENGVNTPQYVFDTLTAMTTVTITGLVANGNYVFKVKSECEPGSSDYSPLFAFSTSGGGGSDSCAVPTGLAVTNVTATGATLSWNAATGALHYQVEVENGVNTPQYVFDTLTASTSLTITGLVANGNYLFKVKSECEPGSSDYSPWFAFSTTVNGLAEASGFPVPDFTLYPNPAGSEVWLRFENQENMEWRIRIFNSIGRPLQELNYRGSGGEAIRISLIDLPAGVYSIVASNAKGFLSKQFLVLK